MTTEYGFDRMGRLTSTSTESVEAYYAYDEWEGGGMNAYSIGRNSLLDQFTYDELGQRITSTNGAGNGSTKRGLMCFRSIQAI